MAFDVSIGSPVTRERSSARLVNVAAGLLELLGGRLRYEILKLLRSLHGDDAGARTLFRGTFSDGILTDISGDSRGSNQQATVGGSMGAEANVRLQDYPSRDDGGVPAGDHTWTRLYLASRSVGGRWKPPWRLRKLVTCWAAFPRIWRRPPRWSSGPDYSTTEAAKAVGISRFAAARAINRFSDRVASGRIFPDDVLFQVVDGSLLL